MSLIGCPDHALSDACFPMVAVVVCCIGVAPYVGLLVVFGGVLVYFLLACLLVCFLFASGLLVCFLFASLFLTVCFLFASCLLLVYLLFAS